MTSVTDWTSLILTKRRIASTLLSFLDVHDLAIFSRTNKTWKAACALDELWLTVDLSPFSPLSVGDVVVASLVIAHPHIQKLNLKLCSRLTPKAFSYVCTLKQLRELNLEGVGRSVSDQVVAALSNCSQLRYLNVAGCPVTASGFKILFSSVPLVSLTASGVDDSTLSVVATSSSLQHLILHGASNTISEAALMQTAKHLNQRLLELHLSYCSSISERGIAAVVAQCPQLRVLNLYGVGISCAVFQYIGKCCPFLTRLDLGLNTQLTDLGVYAYLSSASLSFNSAVAKLVAAESSSLSSSSSSSSLSSSVSSSSSSASLSTLSSSSSSSCPMILSNSSSVSLMSCSLSCSSCSSSTLSSVSPSSSSSSSSSIISSSSSSSLSSSSSISSCSSISSLSSSSSQPLSSSSSCSSSSSASSASFRHLSSSTAALASLSSGTLSDELRCHMSSRLVNQRLHTQITTVRPQLGPVPIEELNLYDCHTITDVGIALLGLACPRLTSLSLWGLDITAEGVFRLLSTCRTLRRLDLGGCSRISQRDFQILASRFPHVSL
eukprot:TRINITY_DN183_c2_g3_i1.p1 TRINITY_DN183_c2_g3~~TRINITY_DN183_c2_g3_i1.p1  ORF type:complete len:551 (-),score=193.56 TRINITY_DN183_c2_g3_i1:92-1744(-)